MDLIKEADDRREANRFVELERRQLGGDSMGDFSSTVLGFWVKLKDDGTGLCSYKDKTYTTRPLGRTSIRKGTPVELFFADGVYYSNW